MSDKSNIMDFGSAEDWKMPPHTVLRCIAANHKREDISLGGFWRQSQCNICGYKYTYDSLPDP